MTAMQSEAAATVPQGKETQLATPSSEDLYHMYVRGNLQRYVVVAALMNRHDEVLLLEHTESEKCKAGMWGPFGETPHLQVGENGVVTIEPTIQTVMRGIYEEMQIQVASQDFRADPRHQYFDNTWPVGINFPGQFTAARNLILFVEPELEEAILDAPNTDEISAHQFIPVDEALAFAIHAEQTQNDKIRPGMDAWMGHLHEMLPEVDRSRLAPVQYEKWAIHGQTQDAIFKNIWG